MTKEFWINLPVKNVARSKEFFTALGFKLNTRFPDSATSASFFIGEKNVVLMLFDEPSFKNFTNHEITNTAQSTEVLFSIDAESKEEVDAITQKAVEAGGKSNHKPSDMKGWMYGSLFMDPDGHRWNVLFMDMSKMPK